MPDHLTVASCSTENMAIWNSCNIDIPQSLSSCDMFLRRKFENRAWIRCRLGPILPRPTISFEIHAKIAKDIDQRAIFGSLKAPWPSPWIGSRSHQHAQYMYNYQLIWPRNCSLAQYRNMAIWISWNIDIVRSLNSCDSFHRRKFENRATKSCRPGPILSSATISFELRVKMAEVIDLEKCNFWNFRSSVDLDLRSVWSHTGLHIWSRSTHTHQIRSKSEKLFLWTYGRTYGRTHPSSNLLGHCLQTT